MSSGHLRRWPESGTSRTGGVGPGGPPARGAVAVPVLLVGSAVRVRGGPVGLPVEPKGGGVGSDHGGAGVGPSARTGQLRAAPASLPAHCPERPEQLAAAPRQIFRGTQRKEETRGIFSFPRQTGRNGRCNEIGESSRKRRACPIPARGGGHGICADKRPQTLDLWSERARFTIVAQARREASAGRSPRPVRTASLDVSPSDIRL